MGMDVKLPNLGDGADSGTVVSVLVKPGALIKKGQNIIELETGKAVAPIPSPADGTVSRIAVKEGDQLQAGHLILVLEGGGAGGSGKAKSEKPVSAAPPAARHEGSKPKPGRVVRAAAPVVESEGVEADDVEAVEAVVNEDPAAGPYVRRVARDLGIDLRVVPGSGKSGQVLIGDLKDYVGRLRARARAGASAAGPRGAKAEEPAGTPAPAVDFAKWGPVTRKPLSVLRRTIAERMVESATRLPAVTQFDDADVTVLEEWRKKHAPAYEAKGTKLTLTSFVVRCLARQLRKHPIFNASLDDAAQEIVLKDYVHIGLAVDTEAGLLVPVLRDADKKDMLEVSREIRDLAAKARERKLGLADMQGGTFTLSNQGGIGGAHFTPIINRPEAAILGLGRSQPRPVVRDGKIEVRTLMPLALTYDHRLIDGGSAARFMVDLVSDLERFSEDEVRL